MIYSGHTCLLPKKRRNEEGNYGQQREGIVTLLKTVSEIITHPIVEQALNYGGSMLLNQLVEGKKEATKLNVQFLYLCML